MLYSQSQRFSSSFTPSSTYCAYEHPDVKAEEYRRMAYEHRRKSELALILAEELERRARIYEIEVRMRQQLTYERQLRELEQQRPPFFVHRQPSRVYGYRVRPRSFVGQPAEEEVLERQRTSLFFQLLNANDFNQEKQRATAEPVPADIKGKGKAREEGPAVSTKPDLFTLFATKLAEGGNNPGKSSLETQRPQSRKLPEPFRTSEKMSTRQTALDTTASSPRSASFSSIESIQSEFDQLRSAFAFPETLEFASSVSANEVPRLLFNARNGVVSQYDADLTKLLTRLDAVESEGAASVRGARKALVMAIEAELDGLERRKREVWGLQKMWDDAVVEQQVEDVSPAAITLHTVNDNSIAPAGDLASSVPDLDTPAKQEQTAAVNVIASVQRSSEVSATGEEHTKEVSATEEEHVDVRGAPAAQGDPAVDGGAETHVDDAVATVETRDEPSVVSEEEDDILACESTISAHRESHVIAGQPDVDTASSDDADSALEEVEKDQEFNFVVDPDTVESGEETESASVIDIEREPAVTAPSTVLVPEQQRDLEVDDVSEAESEHSGFEML